MKHPERTEDYLQHIAEAYFDVNIDVLWGTVKEDPPKLKRRLMLC
jgi:uncharacterized protein with HEPN domain